MYNKTKIYNLALGALLLQKKIANADSDDSVERNTLETFWETALNSALEDLDLNATSQIVSLELIEEDPNDLWSFAYKYPSNTAFIRRIVSSQARDTADTRVPLRVGIHEGRKVIFTNQDDAEVEIVTDDFNLSVLSSNAALAIAHKLAWLAAPLIVRGDNVQSLTKSLLDRYNFFKSEAQRHDYLESMTFESEDERSAFVRARIE